MDLAPIFDASTKLTKNEIKDIINLINQYKFDQANIIAYEIIGLLNSGMSVGDIMNDLETEKFGWASSFYSQLSKARTLDDDLLAKPPEIREGENECPKCKQKKTLVVEMQTRSADEGYTYYIHCFNPNCKAITR